jgi:AcrR family transcriptional regulator
MGEKTWEELDPRIRRTRKRLQRALEELLETREFDQISVQDVADKASVNRATFYDHYADKYALLECMVASRFHEFLAESGVKFDASGGAELKGIVLAVCHYLSRMQGPEANRELEPHMESAMISVVRGLILDGLKQNAGLRPEPPEMVAAAASWALYGAAKEWALTTQRCGPEEGAEQVAALITPLLERASTLGA